MTIFHEFLTITKMFTEMTSTSSFKTDTDIFPVALSDTFRSRLSCFVAYLLAIHKQLNSADWALVFEPDKLISDWSMSRKSKKAGS